MAIGAIDAKRSVDWLCRGLARNAVERNVIALAVLDMQAIPIAVARRRNLSVDGRADRELGLRTRVPRRIAILSRTSRRKSQRHQRGTGHADPKLSTHLLVSHVSAAHKSTAEQARRHD